MAVSALLPIGTITKAHGIRGEVSVAYHAESLCLLQGEVYIQIGAAPPTRRKVISWRRDHTRLLLCFEGMEDRNAAEYLRGAEILVPADALPPLDSGEIYLHELLGMAVIEVKEDGSESFIGSIQGISNPAGQELWSIHTLAGGEKLFPAVPEFVCDIDLDQGTVRVCPPSGLFDL